MTADTPDVAKLAAEMRACAEAGTRGATRMPYVFVDGLTSKAIIALLGAFDARGRDLDQASARATAAETARDAALDRVRVLCEVIEPFAKEEATWAISVADNYHPGILEPNQRTAHAKAAFSIGDLRRAARALADAKEARS